MSDNIKRIEFEDGNWWEIRTRKTRGMGKAFRRAGLASLAEHSGEDFDIEDPGSIEAYFRNNPYRINVDAIEDAWLEYGTVDTSFDLKDNSIEEFDALDDTYVIEVIAVMREYYSEPDEEQTANLDGTLSLQQPENQSAV